MPENPTEFFLTETREWLSPDKTAISKEMLEQLRDLLRFHEHRYYVLSDPLISDFEYDQLYKLLEAAEIEHPDWITGDSPTQRVGSNLNAGFATVDHIVPMLSLENSYDAEDLYDWDRKAREISKLEKIEYCVEPKFDGASVSLVYEDDKLNRSVTRGDGLQGDDITLNSKQIRNIPLKAAFSKFNMQQAEIRGEILMSKKIVLLSFNEKMIEEGIPPLANPRKCCSRIVTIEKIQKTLAREISKHSYIM